MEITRKSSGSGFSSVLLQNMTRELLAPNNKSRTPRLLQRTHHNPKPSWTLFQKRFCPLSCFFLFYRPHPFLKGILVSVDSEREALETGSLVVLAKFGLKNSVLQVLSGKNQVLHPTKDPFPNLLLLVKKHGTVERFFAPKHLCSRRAVVALTEIQCSAPPCQTPIRCKKNSGPFSKDPSFVATRCTWLTRCTICTRWVFPGCQLCP